MLLAKLDESVIVSSNLPFSSFTVILNWEFELGVKSFLTILE